MKLAFTNRDLPDLTGLLDNLELPPAPSRARTHLLSALAVHVEAFSRDEYDLVRHYAKLNDDGTPQVTPEGTITLQDPGKASEFHSEHPQLLTETLHVELPDDKAATLLAGITTSSQCFSGDEARALDLLATNLEHTCNKEVAK